MPRRRSSAMPANRSEPVIAMTTGWCSLCNRGRHDEPLVRVVKAERPPGVETRKTAEVVAFFAVCGRCLGRMNDAAAKADPGA